MRICYIYSLYLKIGNGFTYNKVGLWGGVGWGGGKGRNDLMSLDCQNHQFSKTGKGKVKLENWTGTGTGPWWWWCVSLIIIIWFDLIWWEVGLISPLLYSFLFENLLLLCARKKHKRARPFFTQSLFIIYCNHVRTRPTPLLCKYTSSIDHSSVLLYVCCILFSFSNKPPFLLA